MKEKFTHYVDVKPKDLKPEDRINILPFATLIVVDVVKNDFGQYVVELRDARHHKRKTELLIVHKSRRFHINRFA